MSKLQKCRQQKTDCFAYMKGVCKALKDTRFNYPCPFYKSVECVERECPGYFDKEYNDEK